MTVCVARHCSAVIDGHLSFCETHWLLVTPTEREFLSAAYGTKAWLHALAVVERAVFEHESETFHPRGGSINGEVPFY